MRKMIALAGTVALVLLAGIATAEIVAVGKFQLKGLAGENIGERFIYKVNGTMVAVHHRVTPSFQITIENQIFY